MMKEYNHLPARLIFFARKVRRLSKSSGEEAQVSLQSDNIDRNSHTGYMYV